MSKPGRADMRRTDLQSGAIAKIDDAVLLLSNGRYSNAYYLAGYAVELGIKACIAKQVIADTIPDRDFFSRIFSHDSLKLIGLAGLAKELKDAQNSSVAFAANWAISAEWRPDTRYESITAMNAQLLIQAISDDTDGVLPWIKRYW